MWNSCSSKTGNLFWNYSNAGLRVKPFDRSTALWLLFAHGRRLQYSLPKYWIEKEIYMYFFRILLSVTFINLQRWRIRREEVCNLNYRTRVINTIISLAAFNIWKTETLRRVLYFISSKTYFHWFADAFFSEAYPLPRMSYL